MGTIKKRIRFPAIRQTEWEQFAVPAELPPYTVVADALCSMVSVGTELAIYTGSHIGFTLPVPPFPMMPHNPGYALVGEVTGVGESVSHISPGDRVMMAVSHGSAGVADIRHTAVVALPDSLTSANGTMIRLAEIALSSLRLAPIQLGDTVVVFGLGLVGQLVAQLYHAHGASVVIGIDLIPMRLSIANSYGITTLNGHEVDVPETIAELLGDRGPDVVVEATGNPTALAQSLAVVGRGGRVILLGSTRGRVEIDVYTDIHRKGVRVIGAHETAQRLDYYPQRWSQIRNLELLAQLLADGRLDAAQLITHTISPEQALGIHETLSQRPADYLGVLIDWTKTDA